MAAVGAAGAIAIFMSSPFPGFFPSLPWEPSDAQRRSTGGGNRSGIYGPNWKSHNQAITV